MNKKEPLKNKDKIEVISENYTGRGYCVDEEGYSIEDIQLATEWLKDRIKKQSTTRGKAYQVLMKLIDEAFGDIKYE